MSRYLAGMTAWLFLFIFRFAPFQFNLKRPGSTSAYEFARQMDSPKLKKINPALEFNLKMHSLDEPPVVDASFIDGSNLILDTSSLKAAEIRSEFFSRISDIEEAMEEAGTKPNFGADDSAAKKAGGKGKK